SFEMLRTPQSKTYRRSDLGGGAAGAATVGARPTPPQSPMSSGRSGAVRRRSELDRGGMARPPARFYRAALTFALEQGTVRVSCRFRCMRLHPFLRARSSS